MESASQDWPPRSSPLPTSSPARRHWASAPPAALPPFISVSLASSPEAAALGAASSGGDSSPGSHSPGMFSLSPDAAMLGGLPPAAADAGADSEAGEEEGEDLLGFLADLKSKYGLLDSLPKAAGQPVAQPGLIRAASPARLSPTVPPPAPAQHTHQPASQLSVRVEVHRSSQTSAEGLLSQESSVPEQQEQQGQQEEPSVCSPAKQQHPPSQPDASWLAVTEEELREATQRLVSNPVYEPQAGSRSGSRQQAGQGSGQAAGAAAPAEKDGELDGQTEAELAALEALQKQLAGEQQQQAGEEEAEAAQQQPGQQEQQHPGGQGGRGASPPPLQGRRLPWASLHTLLVQRGFPGLLSQEEPVQGEAAAGQAEGDPADPASQPPDPAAVFKALHSLLEEQGRSAAHQQRLAEAVQAAGRRENALVAGFSTAAKKREAEVAKWKRLALDNQLAVRDARDSSRQSSRAGEAAAGAARRLEGVVAQMERELRAKDEEANRLRGALRAQQEREERRAAADREAYQRVKQAYAASKAAETPGAAAATLKPAVGELKSLDICRVFEAERANLAEQAAAAAAGEAAAVAALARAQEALHAAGLPCERFDEIEGRAAAAARRAVAAEERGSQLEEEASLLRLELAARPTQAQYDSLKRQADIMERQLAKAAAEKAAAAEEEQRGRQGGGDGGKSSRPQRRQLSTREMIQRDRNMQRLGLTSVEELPKPVLVELVQDACALLECRAPLELCEGAIRPVQDLAALVPRMERFIGDVCGTVFQRGLAHVPEALRQDNPADVPAILATWIAELGELVEMRGVLRALLRQLASRVSVQPGAPPPTAGEVVPLVASLVELERKVYHSREVLEAAETALAAQPEVLIHRICLHFQQLFGCRSLEGILPAMNKLYLAHTEAQTFLASLRQALGLEAAATLEACANRLEQLLADRRGSLAAMLPAKPPHAAAPALPASAQAVVVEVPPQRERQRELQQAAQVAVERMAARRKWPQVEIFLPAAGAPGARGG